MRLPVRLLSLVLIAAAVGAAEPAAADHHSPWMGVVVSLGALLLGIVQFVVPIVLVAFCVTKGLGLLSRLLGSIDIWAEIKKRNVAVALLAAGVVISYTGVISSGIQAMTKSLMALGTGSFFAGAVGLVSGLVQLAVALMVASFAITVVFRVMDKLTTDIDEKAEFLAGNVAIGVVYCGILIAVSQLVAAGVNGIGTGLGLVLDALVRAIW